jgi:cell wall-associated NlpC family hydrolase
VAIRLARRVHPLHLLPVLATITIVGFLTPTFATAKPGPATTSPQTIASVQRSLGRLALRNTQLVERFDHARVLVQTRQREADAAQAVADRAQAKLQRATVEFTQMIQAQYESGQLGAAGALLDSQNGGNAVTRLSTLDLLSNHSADIVAMVDQARQQAAQLNQQAQSALSAATEQRDALALRRTQVTRQIAKYKRTLGMLTWQQRLEYLHRTDPSINLARVQRLPGPPSAAARKAVNFALAQVGKPYVFGAAGPSYYDCSGLTMAAWAHAGVHLPHSAADQYSYGTHVPETALEPGDLLFFYHPIEHVTIYIGDGLMVSAPTEGENVQVVPLSYFQSDYAGATRLH